MSIEEITPKFQTTDGARFETREAAERHESLIEAQREYEAAAQKFGRCVALCETTADGEPFRFRNYRSYWHVVQPVYSMPRLRKVDFYGNGKDVTVHEDSTVSITESVFNSRPETFRISELYASQDAANPALLEAMKSYVAECEADIARLENPTTKIEK